MSDWLQTVFQHLGVARYNSSPPTVASGDVAEFQCDQRGRLLVSVAASVDPGQQAARTRYIGPVAGSAGALAASGACKLIEVKAQNRSTNDRFLHLFDSTNAPTPNISVPKISYKLAAGDGIGLDYHLKPHECSNGVFWAVSTGTSPYVASADLFFLELVTESLS